MTSNQAREAQLRQIASGIIVTSDPIWRADDRPTVWDRIRELRSETAGPMAPIFG